MQRIAKTIVSYTLSRISTKFLIIDAVASASDMNGETGLMPKSTVDRLKILLWYPCLLLSRAGPYGGEFSLSIPPVER